MSPRTGGSRDPSLRGSRASSRDRNGSRAHSMSDGLSAQRLTRQGMQKFLEGNVDTSLEDFDAVLAINEKYYGPRLWQRGINLVLPQQVRRR